MRRGQGSLEYLLILAAILALAVIVVLIANMMLGSPQEASIVTQDKYNFAVNGWEVKGYDKPYDPNNVNTKPSALAKDGVQYVYGGSTPVGATPIGAITGGNGTSYPIYIGGGDYYIGPSPLPFPTRDQSKMYFTIFGLVGKVAQTFTPAIGTKLANAVILVRLGSTCTNPVTIQITTTDGAGLPTATVLASKTITATSALNEELVTVDFTGSEPALSAGTMYAIVSPCVAWKKSYNPTSPVDGTDYTRGTAYVYVSGVWQDRGDLNFMTYMI